MKIKTKKILTTIYVLTLCGCSKPTENSPNSDNAQNTTPSNEQLLLKLPADELEIKARKTELDYKISEIIASQRQMAKIHCVGSDNEEACVRQILNQLEEPSNIRKIMNKINAKPNEYDLVYSIVQENLMRGF